MDDLANSDAERKLGSILPYDLKLLVAQRMVGRSSAPGIIYYIGCPETHRVKIGFTTSKPEARRRALQTGSPTNLLIMAFHPGSMEDEAKIHRCFEHARLHGEWFENAEDVFELMIYVCWVAAVDARRRQIETPHWAQVGLCAVSEQMGVDLPTDLGGRLA